MRMNTSFWKRLLAAVLSFVMVLGMVPAMNLLPAAQAAEDDDTTTGDTTTGGQQTTITGNYITLPITIRDFAADGMLFEYNETDRTTFTRNDDGSITWGTPNTVTITDRLTYNQSTTNIFGEKEPWLATYNATDDIVTAAGYCGIYIHPASSAKLSSFGDWWYCIIIDANGNVLKTLPIGAGSKATFDADMAATYTLPNGTTATPAYSVWAWRDAANVPYYSVLAKVTEENKGQYRIGLYNADYSTSDTSDWYSTDTINFYLGIPYKTTEPAANAEGKYLGIYSWAGNSVPGGYANYTWWTRIVCDSDDGQVVAIIPAGTADSTYGTSDYNVVMIHSNDSASLELFSHITEDNMSEYQIVTPTCDVGGALFIERTIQINESNTRGFGLLFTKDQDVVHNLYDDGDDDWTDGDQGTITGSELLSFTPSETVTYQDTKLWDEGGSAATAYATQHLYAGLMRTNLVAEELDVYGNPRYTEGTVTYLAEYMQVVMATPEMTDGVYNGHHVMGTKMYGINDLGEIVYWGPTDPDATMDLADVIRLLVDDDFSSTADDAAKLGSYSESRTKFEAGNLDTPLQIATWYDAAYYLLHSTWRDSSMEEGYLRATDGYGLKIDNYNRIHLIETVNADGQVCYVFNAAYDGTTYDMQYGEIFNSPFKEGEYAGNRNYSVAVLKGETDGYTSMGIKLPVNRFDPLGPSGAGVDAGFKMTGNTYGQFNGAEVTQDWSEYYYETNYNQSLEGHAQFVYHQDASQYFTFTGDDDVYLYINGHRVLDIGGAHGITKVKVNLNEVAAYCEMVDGGTYSFDFYYLERHGTAANFGIETNIQIADASMNTFKTGYQGGANTGYGGPVDPNTHVGYSFELQNDGTANIYNLTFDDPAIGVHFGYDYLQYYPAGYTEEQKKLYSINDLYMIYWDELGVITEYLRPGQVTETILVDRLTAGLEPGERIGIFGFKYKIPENQWVDDSFTNTVITSATPNPDGTGTPLHGVADWKVTKMEIVFSPFHVYDWVNKNVSQNPNTVCDWRSPETAGLPSTNADGSYGVTVPKSKLIQYLAGQTEVPANAQIVQCNAAGYEDAYNQNPNVRVNADGSITYTSTATGMDTVFYKIQWTGNEYNEVVFNYDVYTYGTVNNTYVLDYGLAVELAGANFGFQHNDAESLAINQNSRPIISSIQGILDGSTNVETGVVTHQGTYGNFDYNPNTGSLKYIPGKIMNGTDSVFVKFRVVESEIEEETNEKGETVEVTVEKPLDIYTGVELVQEIKIVPANVVYYEDTFPGITFVTGGSFGNWVQYETKDSNGNSVAGIEQSANPDENYGYDENYKDDKDGKLVNDANQVPEEDRLSSSLEFANLDQQAQETINKINEYLGNRGGDSNGTVKELVIATTTQTTAMWFDFTGTGVEIIGRTTDDAYAVINVQLLKKNADGEYAAFRMKPVITESIGGDQYQVPIITFTGLEKGEYRVQLNVAKSVNTTVQRMLYIDGVRIYGPLSDDEAIEYYNPEEYKAEFYEIKGLIGSGDMIFCSATDTDNKFQSVTGNTLVEDQDDLSVLTSITSSIEYLEIGPNNELYIRGGTKPAVIAFFMQEIPNYVDGARTLQIGAHRKADSDTLATTSAVNLVYGSLDTKLINAKEGDDNFYSISSGTEMYYTIDIKQLTYDENLGGWIVMIGTNGASVKNAKDVLSLTNIKVAGYTISSITEAFKNAEKNNTTPSSLPIVTQPLSVVKAWVAAANQEPEVEELPVNENLRIEAVGFSEDTVASGYYAMLTVKASAAADSIVIYDADGRVVELESCNVRTKKGYVFFDVTWVVTGNRGDKQTYSIRVLDAEKNASVNTEYITVTIV